MISYKSPITNISLHSFDDLMLQVSELQALLAAVTNTGNCDNETGLLIGAAERLAQCLQADMEAMHTAYRNQHGGYLTDATTPASSQDNAEVSE